MRSDNLVDKLILTLNINFTMNLSQTERQLGSLISTFSKRNRLNSIKVSCRHSQEMNAIPPFYFFLFLVFVAFSAYFYRILTKQKNDRLVILTGRSGCGKTALLYFVINSNYTLFYQGS